MKIHITLSNKEWPYENYNWPKHDNNDAMTNFDDFNYSDGLDIDDTISFLQKDCIHQNSMKPEFNRIEMEEISSVLVAVPENLLPMNTPADNIDIMVLPVHKL